MALLVTCTECEWTGTLHEAGSHDCIDVEDMARDFNREYRDELRRAVARYAARKEDHGVEIQGGTCIAEDHTGHGHEESS